MPVPRTTFAIGLPLAILLVLLRTEQAPAQEAEKPLKNTTAIMVFGGYGTVTPSQRVRQTYDGSKKTSYGGLHIGVQLMFAAPRIWNLLSIGGEFSYQRVAKKYIGEAIQITNPYVGEFEVFEKLEGMSMLVFGDVKPLSFLHVQLGGGGVILDAWTDADNVDAAFPTYVDPVMQAAAIIAVPLSKDGISLDVHVRWIQEFGHAPNSTIQIAMGFGFRNLTNM